MSALIGMVGSLLVVLAWMPEAYRIYKAKNIEAIDVRFFFIYLAGQLMLLVYALLINDVVFISLQIALVTMALVQIDLVLRKRHARIYKKRAK